MTGQLIQQQNRYRKLFPDKKCLSSAFIVPRDDVCSSALTLLIAIMTFLASLTLGGVSLIQISAQNCKNQIAREAIVQIFPVKKGVDMEKVLDEAVAIVKSFGGINDVRVITRDETESLLKPLFGFGFDMGHLPVPQLIIMTLKNGLSPDFDGLYDILQQNIPGVHFDDHRVWIGRFVSLTHSMTAAGVTFFCLVLIFMILAIVLATREVLLSNSYIIEALYLISADTDFVSRQFDCHFFRIGFKGAIFGSVCAIAAFFLTSAWLTHNYRLKKNSQAFTLLGNISANWINLVETFTLVIAVSVITMCTSHYVIRHQFHKMRKMESDFFIN